MCIIPFWLVDWETAGWPLGDCWLAPGKAATAGCTGRLLAGPWEGWLAPGKAAGCAELLIFADRLRWVNLRVRGGYDLRHVSGYGVDMFHGKESIWEEANMATNVQIFSLGIYRISAPKWKLVDFNDQNKGWCVFFLHLRDRWALS